MADVFDVASEREEQDRDLALQFRKQEGPAVTGYCRYCDEPLQSGQRFCNATCRDGWERFNGLYKDH